MIDSFVVFTDRINILLNSAHFNISTPDQSQCEEGGDVAQRGLGFLC